MRPLNLPLPPATYDPSYLNRVVNAITLWAAQFDKPVEMQIRFVNASELPDDTSLTTIPAGSLYCDTADDTIKRKP